ncbi:MAG: cytochrome c maturation protein CcmE [Bacteroidetes bacterium]|nr:cytochrome c maturation protein CcmE [Bacteroidota bacterium]
MKPKVIIAGLLILFGLGLGVVNFIDTNIEYGDFSDARRIQQNIQVKGEWVREKASSFDNEKMQFTFYLKDDSGEICRVVLDGAKPNNFDLASSVVVKGRIYEDYFHATEVLTKCPSRYEGKTGAMKKNR